MAANQERCSPLQRIPLVQPKFALVAIGGYSINNGIDQESKRIRFVRDRKNSMYMGKFGFRKLIQFRLYDRLQVPVQVVERQSEHGNVDRTNCAVCGDFVETVGLKRSDRGLDGLHRLSALSRTLLEQLERTRMAA
jgi:hypothetical protein